MNYLSFEQVADELQVGYRKVLALVECGQLEAFDLRAPGSTRPRRFVSRTSLDAFLASRRIKPKGKPAAATVTTRDSEPVTTPDSATLGTDDASGGTIATVTPKPRQRVRRRRVENLVGR